MKRSVTVIALSHRNVKTSPPEATTVLVLYNQGLQPRRRPFEAAAVL